jgi:AcrR family transcriptional regulator
MQPAQLKRSSSATKARILEAARQLFSREGYELTTVRGIAAAAQTDPALVVRYFGSKERLFAEAAAFDLRLPDMSALSRETRGAALVRHFLERWEGEPGDHALRILLRTAASNPQAAGRMREIFSRQLLPAVAHIAPAEEAERRAGLVATQMLGFALCRYVLSLPGVVSMDWDTAAMWLAPTIQRYLAEASVPDLTSSGSATLPDILTPEKPA